LALVQPLAAGEVSVPFKAVGVTTSEQGPFPGPGPNQLTLLLAGTGRGTHLGRMTSTATIVMTFSPEGIPIAFAGALRLVAANGDELYVSTSGVPTPQGGTGGYTITGGTGRFIGATGSGSFTKTAAVGKFDGKITLVRGR